MSRTEKITVTAEHIERGEKRNPCTCPIALAINDAHPGSLGSEVYLYFAATGDPLLTAVLPIEAVGFLESFDEGLPVEPFELDLTWQTYEEIKAEADSAMGSEQP